MDDGHQQVTTKFHLKSDPLTFDMCKEKYVATISSSAFGPCRPCGHFESTLDSWGSRLGEEKKQIFDYTISIKRRQNLDYCRFSFISSLIASATIFHGIFSHETQMIKGEQYSRLSTRHA